MQLLYGIIGFSLVAVGQAGFFGRGAVRDFNINEDAPRVLCAHNNKLCVNLTLHCHHEQNEYQVVIKPQDGAEIPESLAPVPGDPSAIIDNGGAVVTISGELSNWNIQATNQTCHGEEHHEECSFVRTGSVSFRLHRVVPGSLTQLVELCHFSPINPPPVDTLPNIPSVQLEQCEDFDHTLEVFPHPIPEACILAVEIKSSAAPSGYGYKLQKCYLNLPGRSVPLITNGKSQKSAQTEVTARSADGGSGLKYRLGVVSLGVAEVRNGALHCEVERCRSSIVASGSFSDCPKGLLPSDFSTGARHAEHVLNTSQMSGARMAGDVKLYIPNTSSARSSAVLFKECTAKSV